MNNKAQFTPGPWSLCNWMVGNNTPTGEVTICGPEGDEHICTMDGNEDNQANGNLIAAAPEMYAALQAALCVCEAEVELRGENDSDDYLGGSAFAIAEMIRAALTKAEGREG